jgi:hypothetical protein
MSGGPNSEPNIVLILTPLPSKVLPALLWEIKINILFWKFMDVQNVRLWKWQALGNAES